MRFIPIAGLPLLAIAFGEYEFTRSTEKTAADMRREVGVPAEPEQIGLQARAPEAMKVAEVAETEAERRRKATEEAQRKVAEEEAEARRKPSAPPRASFQTEKCAAGYMKDSKGHCRQLGDFGGRR
jgi:hypothetical protein